VILWFDRFARVCFEEYHLCHRDHHLMLMSIHLSTVWVRSQFTSSEHALITIVVSWKWYDFLKLVEDGRSTNKGLIQGPRIQWRDQHVIALYAFINEWTLTSLQNDSRPSFSIARIFATLSVPFMPHLIVSSMPHLVIVKVVTAVYVMDFLDADCQLSVSQSFDHLVS
jgi:hypothetical protein